MAETNAAKKMISNLPKNTIYNSSAGLIQVKGKDFALSGFDVVSQQPIFGQVINGKLTGNFKMFVNGKMISTAKPTVRVPSSYDIGSKVLSNLNIIPEFIEGYLPYSGSAGTIAGGIGWMASDPRGQIVDSLGELGKDIKQIYKIIKQNQSKDVKHAN